MKVVKLTIQNFRGIRLANLLFDCHTLMVGTNNVGKSTICEALDLVLGPDRLNRFPPAQRTGDRRLGWPCCCLFGSWR
ncbi:AAA family ATPase [Pseudomonas sp.]|uniref:AAA family ATPase n=1 Tax=Pseudomonas sp. TaxID=306 RepID=UPI0024891400|nr:AAA family ATPase [Pseudomonas sp.]MDI1330171.1 AAA family ATPase [Pseudomonas sp.]